MELNKSKIEFINDGHKYINPEKFLSLMSVTTLIRKFILPDNNYKGVSEAVLQRKANIGNKIHEQCQFYDEWGVSDPLADVEYSAAATDYIRFQKSLGMHGIAWEYIVSDDYRLAGSIDCVWTKDENSNEVYIADIKTTYNFDEEYVMWQTNIYAYLFELLNPHLKVKGLYCVWLPVRKSDYIGDLASITPLEFIDKDLIKNILDNPIEYMNKKQTALTTQQSDLQLITQKAVQMLIEAEETARDAKRRADEIKDVLMQAMKEHGVKSWDSGLLKATYTPEHTGSSFDSRAFRDAEPELYEKYTKEKKVSESLRITIRK